MLDDRTSTQPRNMSLKAYRKMKIKMLTNDFCIQLTDEEIARSKTLKTEAALDQFALGIINKRWG